ncbi:MAG TPA: hypothetical protein VGE57_00575 [Solimonas sp.]
MFNRIATTALVLGLSLSAANAVAAEPTPVFTAPIGQEAHKSKRFAINPELGRAWVEIDVTHSFSETNESHRVAIPGLAYNTDSRKVVYDAEGKTVVCANVRETGSWLFKSQRIEPTGDCELTRKYVKVPIDDGFAVDVIEHFEVHFKPAGQRGSLQKDAREQG